MISKKKERRVDSLNITRSALEHPIDYDKNLLLKNTFFKSIKPSRLIVYTVYSLVEINYLSSEN